MKQQKIYFKIFKYILAAVLAVFLLDAGTLAFFSLYRPEIPQTDAAIILGAAINTPALYNRSLEGLRLYQQRKTNLLVLSGGRISDEDISEAAYMKKTILKNEFAPVPFVLEDQSHTTYENIKNSKKLIPDAKSIIIVSDIFHLARGVIMAKREGFAHVYWSAPDPNYYNKKDLAFYYFREFVALIDYIPKFIKG